MRLFTNVNNFEETVSLLAGSGIVRFRYIKCSRVSVGTRLACHTGCGVSRGRFMLKSVITFANGGGGVGSLPGFSLLANKFPYRAFDVVKGRTKFRRSHKRVFFHVLSVLTVGGPGCILLRGIGGLQGRSGKEAFGEVGRRLRLVNCHICTSVFGASSFRLPRAHGEILVFTAATGVSSSFSFSSGLVTGRFSGVCGRADLRCFRAVSSMLVRSISSGCCLSRHVGPALLSSNSSGFGSGSSVGVGVTHPLATAVRGVRETYRSGCCDRSCVRSRNGVGPISAVAGRRLTGLPVHGLAPRRTFVLRKFPTRFTQGNDTCNITSNSLCGRTNGTMDIGAVCTMLCCLVGYGVVG